MDFITGLVNYFTNALDASMYITYAILTFALVIFDWPKVFNKKNTLILILKFVGIYVFYVFFESFAFALGATLPMTMGMILVTSSFLVPTFIFIPIFLKESAIHKLIKMAIAAASLMTLGQTIGLLIDILDTVYNNATPPILNVFCRTFPYIILLGISIILKKFDIGRYQNLTRSQIILVLFTSTSLLTISLWEPFIETDNYSYRWLLVLINSVMLFVLIYMYYSMHSAMQKRHRITTLEVQSSLLELEKDSLEIDIKNREELIKIRHDLNNQLSYINALLCEHKYEEAHEYLQGLLSQKQDYLDSFSCPNVTISGIVNLILTKAKIAETTIKFRVVVPPRLPFEGSDLLSLLTNIADNCIENFTPVDDKDAINIAIITQQDYLRITSYNTVDVEKINQKFLSTTKSGKNHGYGTKIIKNITEKYHGHSSFALEENKFVCDCVLDMSYRGTNNA